MSRPGDIMEPFIRWSGGKRLLSPDILATFPPSINTYYEPMVGGGAVFFALAGVRRFQKAVICDVNEDLMCCYRQVRDGVGKLIQALEQNYVPYTKDEAHYYQIRALNPLEMSETDRAARFLYLNKTCFNGLYRVNRAGQFNVPFGSSNGRTPIFNFDVLHQASLVLHDVDLRVGDYEETTEDVLPGDVIYVDPPYLPLTETSSFTAYQSAPFGPLEHRGLASWARRVSKNGPLVVLSNYDLPIVRDIYHGMEFKSVTGYRSISANAEKRGTVAELLMIAGGP